ncbi:MAG TPA: hypothetical protein VEA63_05045, partial [Opitutus sp.]|nr:hypothetical protein [Opitutus sp.]
MLPLFSSLVPSAALALLLSAAIFAAPPPRPWSPDPFTPLTPERIAALPPAERTPWQAYWNASEQLLAK